MKKHKIKLDAMLVASFITTLLYGATYPYIHKMVMAVASEQIIALNQIVTCSSIVIFGFLWNRWSNKLFRFYPLFCVIDTLALTTICVYTISTSNVLVYYLADTFLVALITRNIFCGNNKIRAIRYHTEEEREKFDNNDNSVIALATIIGSLIAMILALDFKTMICIATLGNAIDNIFYIVIFTKIKLAELRGEK